MDIEKGVKEYLEKVGSVDRKDIIEHDFREGVNWAIQQGLSAGNAGYKEPADVRLLPKQEPRIETGVTQFGDDWQGLFLRGDYCADLLGKLSKLLNGDITPIEKTVIYDFHELLKKVRE